MAQTGIAEPGGEYVGKYVGVPQGSIDHVHQVDDDTIEVVTKSGARIRFKGDVRRSTPN